MRSRALLFVTLFALISGNAAAGRAPSFQQGAKLVGTGAVGAAYQGMSVALSADGNTALVGAEADNSLVGAAWVYTRSGGGWIQQGAKLVGTGAVGSSFQGFSVALSADGNTAIVGGFADNSNAGAAWVYTRNSGGVWSQQGVKLVGSGAVGTANQGYSVALSADGNTAIVGGYNDNASAGAVWVYTRSGSVWSQQGAKLVGTGALGPVYQGVSVALSANGNTAIVGGDGDNSNAGAAWVWTRSGAVWTQQGTKLVGTGAAGAALQGRSVALSADGNTAIVGGFNDNSNAGAAWVWTRSGSVWSQQGAKLVGTGALGSAYQGVSVGLSADGNTAIVGGCFDNSSAGAAWVYTRSASVWSQPIPKLVGTGAAGTAEQGFSVALSGDGNTAIVGGYVDNSFAGAAWVYVDPSPVIATVADIPDDQGGRVTLRWSASLLDNGFSDPVTEYWIWRQAPTGTGVAAGAGSSSLTEASEPQRGEIRTSVESGQIYYWEYIGNQIADALPGYSYTAPTTADSVAGFNPYTLYMVETRGPAGAHWPSDPDSGYSVDNLPPGAPAPVYAAYQTGATHLHWGVNPAPDFSLYRIYKGSSASFIPSPGNRISSQPDTGFADVGAAGSYYKLSAVDIHGNESGFTLVTPSGTSGVSGGGSLAFALDPPASPSRGGRIAISFSLPDGEPARLELVDVAGRDEAMDEVGSLGAGRHTVDLAAERRVSPGLYFVRLSQGSRVALARVAVLN